MAFRFFDFFLETPGDGVPITPDIVVYVQPTDRYTSLKNISLSVNVSLVGPTMQAAPFDYDGFIVQRSSDNITFSDVSGVIRDRFFFIDRPPSVGIYYYRARTRVASGAESTHGNVVTVSVDPWGDADDLAASDVQVDGVVTDRLEKSLPFPNGLSGSTHAGMNLTEGSAAGAFGGGTWYVETKEVDPPQIVDNVPVCGTSGLVLPLTVMTFTIRDFPYPTGGSGIDDTSYLIKLSVTSQFAGSPLIIRDGATQPFAAASPMITCVIVPGADPILDRDVTITVPAGYISQGDSVSIITYARDLDGNAVNDTCTFTMETVDDKPPVISEQDPECGLGLTAGDDRRAKRNTSYTFHVADDDSGVDLSTLDVYYGTDPLGPWTQVLSGGSTFLLGFTGSVISDGSTGYNVTINRPAADPLWPADTRICFRIDVDDNTGNSAQDVCCFKTEDCVKITKVTPIAENIVFVQFSGPMKDNDTLRDPRSYTIQGLDAGALPLVVNSVKTEQFVLPSDEEQPEFRLGEGNPTFVFLDTSVHEFWMRYNLTVNGLIDEYGLDMCEDGQSINYRGRRTKVDEGRDNMKDPNVLTRDSVMRRILIGILQSDEEIGGVFTPDDWESE